MSQLTDAIQQAGVENVAAGIVANPDFRVFNLLWSDPKEILTACEAMNWQTTEELLAWIQAVNQAIGNTVVFEQLVDPVAAVDSAAFQAAKTIAWPELHKAIHATGLLSTDCLLHNSDASYRLLTKEQWSALAAACSSKRRKHSASEQLDCDDFVRIALGWLSSKGLGNCAAAFAATRHCFGNQPTGGHAVILVWDDTLTCWQWEPQNGLLYPASYPKLGGNFLANKLEYARVFA